METRRARSARAAASAFGVGGTGVSASACRVSAAAAAWAVGAIDAHAAAVAEDDLRKLNHLNLGDAGSLNLLGHGLERLAQEKDAERRMSHYLSKTGMSFKADLGNDELVLEIDVPEGVSDDEIIARVREMALMADGLHRSLGGRGLKVERLEVHQEAGVPVGAPDV